MDDFRDLEEEISKLDTVFSEDDFLGRLRAPAGGDYWKRRLEEEKELWSKTIEAREKENKRLEQKLASTEEELKSLQKRLSEIEMNMQKEALAADVRARSKDMELVIEKERANWNTKIKELEKENEHLKARVEELKLLTDEAAKNAQLRISQLSSSHQSEINELLRQRQEIDNELEEVSYQVNEIQTDANKNKDEIKTLNEKIEELKGEKAKLGTALSTKEDQFSRSLIQHKKQTEYLLTFLINRVRKYSGIVLGILEYCAKRLQKTFTFSKTVLSRQLLVADNAIRQMTDAVSEMKTILVGDAGEKVTLNLLRFINRIDEDANVSDIPQAVSISVSSAFLENIKVLKDKIKKTTIKYSDKKGAGELEIRLIVENENLPSEEKILAVGFSSSFSGVDFSLKEMDAGKEFVFCIPVLRGEHISVCEY
ncbi:MAG: hypothetical protein AB1633_04810 [Elusimicrobiota bacterium]